MTSLDKLDAMVSESVTSFTLPILQYGFIAMFIGRVLFRSYTPFYFGAGFGAYDGYKQFKSIWETRQTRLDSSQSDLLEMMLILNRLQDHPPHN